LRKGSRNMVSLGPTVSGRGELGRKGVFETGGEGNWGKKNTGLGKHYVEKC